MPRGFKFIAHQSTENDERPENDDIMSVGSFRQKGAFKRRFISIAVPLFLICLFGSLSFLCGRYLGGLRLSETNVSRGPEITLRVLDLNDGESCLLTTPTGRAVLIDGGSDRDPAASASVYLHGRRCVDFAILTSSRPRALGGFKELIESGLVRGLILIPCSLDELKNCGRAARDMIETAKERNIYLIPCDRYLLTHNCLFYDDPELQIASIPVSTGPRRIETMALKIEFGASSILYAAGLSGFDERKLLASQAHIQCDALVLSGAEDDDAPLPELIASAGPEAIAMSCNDGNKPSEQVQSWLAASGATIGQPDILGDYALRLPYYANQPIEWSSSKSK